MKVLNINDGPGVFIKYLETAIRHGKSVLFENIDEELDPTLDPVLEKSFNYKLGQKFLKLGDNDVDYNENFRMFFTTKLPNPKYSPEIMGKTMVINYTVTLQGLRD
jgi:dynein heavy chain